MEQQPARSFVDKISTVGQLIGESVILVQFEWRGSCMLWPTVSNLLTQQLVGFVFSC